MPDLSLPNFVIIGAPKCGTTSVAQWLAQHPDAGMTKSKEPFYLVDEALHVALGSTGRWYGSNGLQGYRELFRHVTGSKVRFEATTHYIYQHRALEVLASLEPRPKVLAMIRKPSERFRSSFEFWSNHLAHLDRSLTFERAVEHLLRGTPEELRSYCKSELAYLSLRDGVRHGEYLPYLEKWQRVFQDDLQVWTLDDVIGAERSRMKDLAGWLGIDPGFYDEAPLERENSGYRVRWPLLHRTARDVARRARVPRALSNAYWTIARQRPSAASRSSGQQEALGRLQAHYAEQVSSLATFLRRPALAQSWNA